jgi:hypothetical protein
VSVCNFERRTRLRCFQRAFQQDRQREGRARILIFPSDLRRRRNSQRLDPSFQPRRRLVRMIQTIFLFQILLQRLLNAQGKYHRSEWQEHERLHRLRMSHLSRFGSPGRVPGRLQHMLKSSHVSRSGSPDPLSRFTNSRANLSRPTSPSLRPVSPFVERTLVPLGATSRPENRERNLSGLPETGRNTLDEESGRFGSPDLGRPATQEKVLRVPRLDLSAAIAYQEGGESDRKARTHLELLRLFS